MAKASSPTDTGKQKVRSAEVGTDILKALAELSPSTSLSRLAEHVQMPASKVHRYLQALIASGFAEQNTATNHYGLGREALRVGLAALGSIDVLKIAALPLSQLRDELNMRVMHGYGASRADLQRVGGTGDGGIDGVISLDRLGLEKVYIQAKRWQSNVGRPDLQAFYGALAGQKAKKGVFITTSGFTAHALDFAKSVEGIVLLDGPRLASLMIECELGVTSRTVKIPKIDGDYFDEELA